MRPLTQQVPMTTAYTGEEGPVGTTARTGEENGYLEMYDSFESANTVSPFGEF